MADIAWLRGIYPPVPVMLCDREWRIFPADISLILDICGDLNSACYVLKVADVPVFSNLFARMFHVETYSEIMWIETLICPARPRRAAFPRSRAAGGRVRAKRAWPCAGRGRLEDARAGVMAPHEIRLMSEDAKRAALGHTERLAVTQFRVHPPSHGV